MPITKPDAVIFDLDGTLLDTEPLYTKAAQQVVSQFGKNFNLELKLRIMGGDSRTSAATVAGVQADLLARAGLDHACSVLAQDINHQPDYDSPGWVYCASTMPDPPYEVDPNCPGICDESF